MKPFDYKVARAQWEYRIARDLEIDALAALGLEGWELTAVTSFAIQKPGMRVGDVQHVNVELHTVFYFKRALEPLPGKRRLAGDDSG